MAVRRVLAGVAAAVPALVIWLSWSAWRDRVPDRVASHWTGLNAAPDGTSVTTSMLIGTLAVAVAVGVAGLVVAALPLSRAVRRGTLGVLGFLGGLAAGGWVLALVGCGAYAVVPYFLAPPGFAPPGAGPVVSPEGESSGAGSSGAEGVGEPEARTAGPVGATRWSDTIAAPMFGWVSGLLAVVGLTILVAALVAGASSAAVVSIPMLLSALAVALLVRMRVSADRRGLRVTSAVFGVPLKRVPLGRISSVAAIDVDPMEWGGWGYRLMPGKSAIVLRSGPGLAVTTTRGTRFAVTIEHPEVPAALLTTLRS